MQIALALLLCVGANVRLLLRPCSTLRPSTVEASSVAQASIENVGQTTTTTTRRTIDLVIAFSLFGITPFDSSLSATAPQILIDCVVTSGRVRTSATSSSYISIRRDVTVTVTFEIIGKPRLYVQTRRIKESRTDVLQRATFNQR
ncbi:hypothetical protein IE81DRAFT_113179 [Ceraceosorus guamensis]|uniref:Secreted protein n=1 Tax=Ceraceosorus guamensis TaxID=1522189 RepID=A0A316W517_9BASI|nr:hypothetical protein IE81DRAFT_113179 [Ceraceosorus guamensis]PWN42735.1 hypothetical protein IE81DRAFT_113179 [Ceraceosorus guamensis]